MARISTRFAPSPTGWLHLGGARTALFNWLFARAEGGTFRLRIEDTDRERHDVEAERDILSTLQWLGIDWDGDVVTQSERRDSHLAAAHRLLDCGRAYRCFATPDEIAKARADAPKSGGSVLFHSPWRDAVPSEHPSKPYTVRLKTPTDGQVALADAVYGDIAWQCDTLDDLVLVRSDGSPTYNLSVVVDDHHMQLSHVIRGDDHLANTAKQILLYRSLDWVPPRFAHVPLIHDRSGKKLSKRDGVDDLAKYRRSGVLPEAVRNYLVRLGWSCGDRDFMTTADMIELFSLDGLRRAPARIDDRKLDSLAARHLAASDDHALLDALVAFLAQAGTATPSPDQETQLLAALPILKTRCRTLQDVHHQAGFLLDCDDAVSGRARALITGEDQDRLSILVASLRDVTWSHDALDAALRGVADRYDIAFGAIARPLRAALTGQKTSPGVIDVMIMLGKRRSLLRAKSAIQGRHVSN